MLNGDSTYIGYSSDRRHPSHGANERQPRLHSAAQSITVHAVAAAQHFVGALFGTTVA
jgi:hypothetical protein